MGPRLLATLIGFLSGLALSACGSLMVTTWINSARDHELQRKDGHGNIVARKAYVAADDYRCYSPIDDEAWRSDLAQCKAACQK